MNHKNFLALFTILPILALGACSQTNANAKAKSDNIQASTAKGTARAVFAGGCFWCMEKPFDEIDGVLSTVSGYTGGHKNNPTYKEVSAGNTGHTEALEVVFDPKLVSYKELLDVFWVNVDPTKNDRQFCDVGSQYRPEIFPVDSEQRAVAEKSLAEVSKSKTFSAPIVLDITDASTFYPAEDYHQNYYQRNPLRYKYYRTSCGRDARLNELWGNAAKH